MNVKRVRLQKARFLQNNEEEETSTENIQRETEALCKTIDIDQGEWIHLYDNKVTHMKNMNFTQLKKLAVVIEVKVYI